MPTYLAEMASPIGDLSLAGDATGITGLWLQGQRHFASTLSSDAQRVAVADIPAFVMAATWLHEYFEGHDPGFMPPLAPKGSVFRQMVWDILREIPYGQTTTYGAIARQLAERTGRRQAAQAVGGAVGHNPISIIVPCHRVVGTDGSLTGYAGGVERKRRLLVLEGIDPTDLHAPARGTAR